MEIIENFSNLIDCLSFSLEQNKQINYSDVFVPNESAIGALLNKLPTYRSYLKKKIKNEYKERRCNVKPRIASVIPSSYFDANCKKLVALAELSCQFFARYQRAFIRNSLGKTRKWIFKALAHLEKEKNTCLMHMNSSSLSYTLKLQEFMDDFTWKRFFHYLKIISHGIAKVSEKKLTKHAKEKIEEYLKHPVKVSRIACIENLYITEGSHKKGLTRLSNHSKSLDDVKDLLSGFLTLQSTSTTGIIEGRKKFSKDVLLSRSMISHLSSPHWKPFTLHFYVDPSDDLKKKIESDHELNVIGLASAGKVFQLQIEGTENTYLMQVARLNDLIENRQIFYIDSARFHRKSQLVLRSLRELERSELIRVYTSINSPTLHPDIIPETHLDKFNHEYILVNNSLQYRNSSAARNWLVQLEKICDKNAELAICAYPGCLSAKLLTPVDFKVAEMTKTRKKLKKISGNELCRVHQCINLVNKGKKQNFPAIELWNAVQNGLLWRSSIKSGSILGKVLNSKAQEIINRNLNFKLLSINYFKSEKQVELEKTIADPQACIKLKDDLIEELELLRHEKQYESAATEELKKIMDNFSSLNQTLILELKNAMGLAAYEKFCILSRIREKLGRISVCDISRNHSNRSSRPSSAAKEKNKEEVSKRKPDPKLLPSPYNQNPFEKNPSFRLKQIAHATKVPKSKSFALLDV